MLQQKIKPEDNLLNVKRSPYIEKVTFHGEMVSTMRGGSSST
jgi:hypothetical protein